MTGLLNPELDLLAACCRQVFAQDAAARVIEAARRVDGQSLVRAAARHRIEGLAWAALHQLEVPLADDVAQPLAARARTIADHGLRVAAESIRLQRAFDAAAIDLLFLKGLALGKLAYGNPFLKMSWDVDVLIAHDQVAASADLLDGLGYRLETPSATHRHRLAAYHRRRKESVWSHPTLGLHLELHGRVTEAAALIGIGIASPRQTVDVAPGVSLATLARDEQFAYLSVHGAQSGWHRLKWLSDFAGLFHQASVAEIERLYARSQELGAGVAAGQALLLANEIFALPLSEPLERHLRSSPTVRRLTAIALRLMNGPDPTSVRWGTLPIHRSHLLLAPGTASARELMRKLVDLADRLRG